MFRWDHFYRCIFKTVFCVIFILLFSFLVNFPFWLLYISVMKLPFVFPYVFYFFAENLIFFHYFWSIPDHWSISLITTLKSFQIFSTSVFFCCWNRLIVFFSWGWNFSSFPSGKEFWPVSCKFWMLCYNLPGSL